MKIESQKLESVIYKSLNTKDNHEVKKTFACIADCFGGITLNGIRKHEPLNYAAETEKNIIIQFCETFFDLQKCDCFIAIEKQSQDVVGVVLSEIYQPTAARHVFTGEFVKYNQIFRVLNILEDKFNALLMRKLNQNWLTYKFLHLAVIAIKGKSVHSNIFDELVKLTINAAHKNNFAGILTEATNPKSQAPFMNRHGFVNLVDADNQAIVFKYKEDSFFRRIPEDMAMDCKLLYKPINLELL